MMRDWVLRKKQQGHHTLYCEGYHPIIADVYGPDAMAHLIRAAPDLLAAIETLLPYLEERSQPGERWAALYAREAIAKAKGGA